MTAHQRLIDNERMDSIRRILEDTTAGSARIPFGKPRLVRDLNVALSPEETEIAAFIAAQ